MKRGVEDSVLRGLLLRRDELAVDEGTKKSERSFYGNTAGLGGGERK